jgi:hypothetical protein
MAWSTPGTTRTTEDSRRRAEVRRRTQALGPRCRPIMLALDLDGSPQRGSHSATARRGSEPEAMWMDVWDDGVGTVSLPVEVR